MKNCTVSINNMALILIGMVLFAHLCCADSDSLESSQTEKALARNALNPTAPYCGVQAVCLAARAINKDVDFVHMVKPQYIGSKHGSSLSELHALCDALQLKKKSFSHLTANSLYGVTSPLILHTATQADLRKYDHWTLFTGIKNGKAITWKVIAGQSACEEVPLVDLATQWDGNALMVFDDYGSEVYFTIYVWAERIAVIGIITVFLIALVNINSFFRRYDKRINACIGLFVILFISGIAYFVHSHVLYSGSFLVNDNTIKKIQEDNIIGFLPKVSLAMVKKSYKNTNTVIVDTRMEYQYRQGHIENSVNIPYTMSLDEVDAVLKENPKDTTIIVVYEPLGCTRAIDVFQRIKKLGFTNIYRFEDGWNKWEGETQ